MYKGGGLRQAIGDRCTREKSPNDHMRQPGNPSEPVDAVPIHQWPNHPGNNRYVSI